MAKSEMLVVAYDLHFPKVNWPTWDAMMEFLGENEVEGFLFGGDQFHNDPISHHTKGKPLLREVGAYKKEEKKFIEKILDPLDGILGQAEKFWIIGNHDDWEDEMITEQPELDGIQRKYTLGLEERGWEIIPFGEHKKMGKLTFTHGDAATGIGNQASLYHAKKMVEMYCGNLVYGHMHSPQSYTKVLPFDSSEKWMSYCMPTLGDTNPKYLENRPTAWLNGFGIVEFQEGGNFNVYPVIVTKGKFSYGGKTYGD